MDNQVECIKPPLPKGIEDTPEIREKIMRAIRNSPITQEEIDRLPDSFR